MNRSLVSGGALWLVLAFLLPAMEAAPAFFPAAPSSWSVQVISSVQEAAMQVKRIDVVVTRDARRDRITWGDGKETEAWRLGGCWYVEDRAGNVLPVVALGRGSLFGLWRAFDPDQLAWIALAEKETAPGAKTVAYSTDAALLPFDGAGTTRCVIDSTTGWIVQYKDNFASYSFWYGTGGGDDLAVPDRFQRMRQRAEVAHAAPQALGQ